MPLAARLAVFLSNVCAGALLLGCSNLAPLSAGTCGNGVVDPGEDCDSFPASGCGSADAGALACRFECVGNAVCPSGYDCGQDQICRSPTGAFVPLGTPLAVGAVGVTLADFNGDGFADALGRGAVNGIGQTRIQVNYLSSAGASIGTFALADKLASVSTSDVNGDGRADLVGTLRSGNTSGVSVFLGQPTNALAFQGYPTATVPPAALPSALATARVIAFSGLPEGPVSVYFMGTTGGTYPAGLYFPTTNALPDISAPPAAKSLDFFPLPEGPDQLVGDVVVAQFGGTETEAGLPCPSLVYETAAGVVRIVSPCKVTNGVLGLALPPTLTSIALPAGALGCSAAAGDCSPGVNVADVDGDGSPDILVSATATNTAAPGIVYGTYVAYGDGQGTFYSSPVVNSDRFAGMTSGPLSVKLRASNGVLVGAPVQIGETLAAGDVNGDGYADLVARVTQYATVAGGPLAPASTLLTTNPPSGSNLARVTYGATVGQYSWQTAAVADFNGDGHPDVVGGSSGSAGINFFSGTSLAGGMFVPHAFLVPTTGGVSHFAVGDFDGDGVSDLAFGQVDPANDGTVDVSLAYGNTAGALNAPLTIGRFAGLAQITTAPPYPLVEIVGNALGSPGALTITRFTTGVGGRPPLSSEALTSTAEDAGTTPQTAVAAVAGNFVAATALDGGAVPDAGAPFESVAALGQQGSADFLWLLGAVAPPPGAGVVFEAPVVAPGGLPSNIEPALEVGATTNQALLVTAGALKTSGFASLVVVSSTHDAPARAVLLVANAGGSPSALRPTTTNATALTLPLPGAEANPVIAEDGQVALSDLDGDGYVDLVLLTGTSTTTFCVAIDPQSTPDNPTAVATSTARSLVVFWNDQHGGFSMTAPAVIAKCAASANCSENASSCPEAFTTVAASSGALPTLAFVTPAGAFLARFSASAPRQLLPVTALTSTPPASPDGGLAAVDSGAGGSPLAAAVSGYTGIGAGDINGDGVDDLALAADGSLYFFAGVPVRK